MISTTSTTWIIRVTTTDLADRSTPATTKTWALQTTRQHAIAAANEYAATQRCAGRSITGLSVLSIADENVLMRQLPDYPLDTVPLLPEGFECDVVADEGFPCWVEPFQGPEPYLMIFIDYPARSMRKGGDPFRFDLTFIPGGPDLGFTTDDWSVIEAGVRFIRSVRQLGLAFHPDKRGPDYIKVDGTPAFSAIEAMRLDSAVRTVSRTVNPYELSLTVWRAMGLNMEDG